MLNFIELNEERKKKYDRKKLDDIIARNHFKESAFAENKTQIDMSGNLLHKNAQAAINKYGEAKSWGHRVDVDHKVPLKKVYERGQKIGLSDEEIKKIANDRANFRILNSTDNRAKGNNSDLDMALRFLKDGELEKGTKFVVDGLKSEANISGHLVSQAVEKKVESFTERISDKTNVFSKNVKEYASDIAKDAAIPILVAGVHNIVSVVQGDKSIKEAAKDSVVETGAIILSSKLQQIGVDAANQVLKKSGVKLLQQAAGANIIGNVVIIGMRVNDSFVHFLDGKIDAEKFMFEVTMQGGTLAAETMGAMVGQALIPVPIAGAIIGSMITSVVCGLVVDLMRTARDSIEFVKERRQFIEDISANAKSEIDKQRYELERLIKENQEKSDQCFNEGYELIFSGIQRNDVEIISKGLGTVLSQFGENVYYENYGDFNRDFMNEDFEFTL